jgi:hypothetical protein
MYNFINRKQKNQVKRELKKLLIKGYYSTEAYLNEKFSNTGY